ncbi:hypothetical protein CJF42_23725 [Pseudoalteromonas sp. NBT06-2]|uniref:hypothetical protein n=1 Tax=Pseudoalteromonas sp. NBT06-2 TaxID=2025950 RepID=UPI000BA70070|nr:hypothetical protein [Pseudoalteromonas sp. NBT06-2]PAJ71980.1 hypothetical protein CJF42_23725 [Pseudoalteromonas sp. NBT06-2]
MAGFLEAVNTVSIGAASKTVNITGNINCDFVSSGTALFIGNYTVIEAVAGTAPDVNGNSTITLKHDWPNAAVNNTSLLAFNTLEGLRDAINNSKSIADRLVAITQKFQIILTSTNATEAIAVSNSENYNATPYQYLVNTFNTFKAQAETDVQAMLDTMSTSLNTLIGRQGYNEFDAEMAAGKAKYAASGFVSMGWGHSSGNIGNGLWSYPAYTNRLTIGKSGVTSGWNAESNSYFAVINISGIETQLNSLCTASENLCIIKFPPPEDGRRTYNKASGESIIHATSAIAFASETADIEVVTDRVDAWGFEAHLAEVTTQNPFVYPNGLPQSLATTMNGIATTASNRPTTYYAWYEGDTTSKGKGVDWFAANTLQREAMFADKKNKLYLIEGKIYQWRVKGRSFAGAGNGDWSHIDSKLSGNLALGSTGINATTVKPQGQLDVPGVSYFDTTSHALNVNSERGVLTSRDATTSEFNHCYMLVCGTVNRLNLGVYHPSHNKSGARKANNTATNVTGSVWSLSDALTPTSRALCFNIFDASSNATDFGGAVMSGIIGTSSGRPDGRFADAIYASGQGGVQRDMRLSAWDMRDEEWQAADANHKNGTAMGIEKEVFTWFIAETVTVGGTSVYSFANNSTISFSTSASTNPRDTITNIFSGANATHYLLSGDNGNAMVIERENQVTSSMNWPYSNNSVYMYGSGDVTEEFNAKFPAGTVLQIGAMKELNTSVGGEFTALDVLGDPANIVLNPDLKEGWAGRWNPVIPDGTTQAVEISRPIAKPIAAYQTADNGTTWTADNNDWVNYVAYNNVLNGFNISSAANLSFIFAYTANAKVTKSVANAKIHQEIRGIGKVFFTQNYAQRQLCYSLTDNIITRASHGYSESTVNLDNFGRMLDGTMYPNSTRAYTFPIFFPSPTSNSPALKALDYRVNNNGAAYIHYAATELKHDGTDWGDDGLIHVTDNESTLTDLNNNLVKNVTHRTEQLGWIKNNV